MGQECFKTGSRQDQMPVPGVFAVLLSGWGQTLRVKEELQVGSSAVKRNETGS